MRCPKCDYPFIKVTKFLFGKKQFYCENCSYGWETNTRKKPKEISERKQRFKNLSKLPKDYWIELQIDLYEFGKGEKYV